MAPLTDSNSIPEGVLGLGEEKFYITSHLLSGNPNLLMQTENEETYGLIGSTLNWYRTHVSRRAPGDRIQLSGKLYLYKMP